MIGAVKDGEKICEHFHLPVQSGSNCLLEAMNRQYSRERYLELIDEIRRAIPGAAITTDIIVGYRETEADFEQTLDLLERVRFDNAFTFIYSARKGTRAARLKENLSPKEKKERLQEINRLQNRISLDINRTLIDKKVEVLVEGAGKRSPQMQSGRTRTNKLVHFPSTENLTGKLVRVSIEEAHTWHLIGRPL